MTKPGLSLDSEKVESYIDLLKTFNETTNIFSKSAYDRLPFHIEDSLTLAELIGNDQKQVLDIGSGSGLPAILIALSNNNNEVFAVESKQRKTKFLDLAKNKLSLDNLTVVNMNVFEAVLLPNISPDIVTAKAFGSIQKLDLIISNIRHRPVQLYVPFSRQQAENQKLSSKCKIIENGEFIYFHKHYR